MRLRNADAILGAVRSNAEISRADLARETELSPATVSSIVDDLIKAGFLHETGARSTSMGRRPIGLVFNPESVYAAGFRIDNKSIAFVLTNVDGTIKFEENCDTNSKISEADLTQSCIDLLKNACESSSISFEKIGALGIAAPGPLKEGSAPIEGIREPEFYISVREKLSNRLEMPVSLDSMVNMAALAEGMRGEGKGSACLVYFRLEHALRSAVLVNNSLLTGKNHLAGEVGHTVLFDHSYKCHCGKIGCVNAIAALPHFLNHLKNSGIEIDDDADFSSVLDDQRFVSLMSKCANAVAYSIASVINMLAPDAVVLSAPYLKCGDSFLAPFSEALSRYTQMDLLAQCKILHSQTEGSNEAYGAALSAIQSYPLIEQLQTRI